MQHIGRLVTDIQKGAELALGQDHGIRTIFDDPDVRRVRQCIVPGIEETR